MPALRYADPPGRLHEPVVLLLPHLPAGPPEQVEEEQVEGEHVDGEHVEGDRVEHEPLPAVVLAAQLRGLPLFASVPVDELFRIAAASRQVRHDPGTVLLTERSVPEMLHVLLDGEVQVIGAGAPPLTERSGARLRRAARAGPPVRFPIADRAAPPM